APLNIFAIEVLEADRYPKEAAENSEGRQQRWPHGIDAARVPGVHVYTDQRDHADEGQYERWQFEDMFHSVLVSVTRHPKRGETLKSREMSGRGSLFARTR